MTKKTNKSLWPWLVSLVGMAAVVGFGSQASVDAQAQTKTGTTTRPGKARTAALPTRQPVSPPKARAAVGNSAGSAGTAADSTATSKPPVSQVTRPTRNGMVATLLLPNLEATLQQVMKMVEMGAAKDLKKVSDEFMRKVGSRLFPHLKHVKLHRAATMLPSMIRPFGVDLSKATGAFLWRAPASRPRSHVPAQIVPVIMVTVERTRFLASLQLLGMAPRLQTYKGASLLSIGQGGNGSALGVLVGDRFYFTVRTPDPFFGLNDEREIRDFLAMLATKNDPLESAFVEAGKADLWKSAQTGGFDAIFLAPNLSRLLGLKMDNPVLQWIQSVGFGVSLQGGYSTSIFVKANPRLKDIFAVLSPGPNAKDIFQYIPPNVGVFSQAHLHLDALMQLPQKLVNAGILPPMLGMMATGKMRQTTSKMKQQGIDLIGLLSMFSGQFASGLLVDQQLQATVLRNIKRGFRGHLHGAFAIIGLKTAKDAGKFLQMLQSVHQKAIKKNPMLGKSLILTQETTQGLPSLRFQLRGIQPFFLIFKGDMMAFAGSATTRDHLAAVWSGAADSLATLLQRFPEQAARYGKAPGNFGVIMPSLLRMIVANMKQLPPQAKFLRKALTRLKWIKFNTHVHGSAFDASFSVGEAKQSSFPLPPAYQGPASAQSSGPNTTAAVAIISLALSPLAGLPIAGLAGVAVPAFLKYVRKSKSSEAIINVRVLANGAISYFDAEHADSNGNPLAKHFPNHLNRKATVGRSVSVNPPTRPCANGSPKYPANPAIWNKAPWRDLKFSITKSHYYQYTFITEGTGLKSRFTVIARGDLDCDGKLSTYTQKGKVNPNSGEVERTNLVITDGLE